MKRAEAARNHCRRPVKPPKPKLAGRSAPSEALRDQVAHLAVAGAEKILRVREINARPTPIC